MSVSAAQVSVPDLRVLIDVSGSMKKNDPNNLRVPAVRLLVGLLPDDVSAGIWTFGQRVTSTVPVGKVDKGWREKARGAAKKIHSREMFTDIEEALKRATSDWSAPDPRFRRNVILLTDGLVDVSKQSEKSEASRQRILGQVLPSISQAGAKIHTIALSSASDHELMEQLSAATGGWYEQVDTADTLDRVFLRLFEQSAPADTLPLKNNRFTVDESITDMTVLVFRNDEERPLHIIEPGGEHYSAADHPRNIKWMPETGYDLVTIERPLRGEWRIDAEQDPDNRVTVVTNLRLEVNRFPAHVLATEFPTVHAQLRYESTENARPDFLEWMEFKMHRQAREAEERTTISLQDEGVPPDVEAGDGIYSSSLGTRLIPSIHELLIVADGGTFSREYRQWVRVHENAVEVNVDVIEDASEPVAYKLNVHAEAALLNTGSLRVRMFKLGEDGDGTMIPKVDHDDWRIELPASYEGDAIEVSIEGERRDGNPYMLARTLHIGVESEPQRSDTTAIEPSEIAVKEVRDRPVKTETGVDWGVIGVFALVENLVLGLIGWAAYMFWKKRRSGKQSKAVEKRASRGSKVDGSTANLEAEQTLVSESDPEDESVKFEAGAIENHGDEVLLSDDTEQLQSEIVIEDTGLSDLDEAPDTAGKGVVEEALDINSDELIADFDMGAEENEPVSSPAEASAMDFDETVNFDAGPGELESVEMDDQDHGGSKEVSTAELDENDDHSEVLPRIDLSSDAKDQDSVMTDALIDELVADSQGTDDQSRTLSSVDLSADKEGSNSSHTGASELDLEGLDDEINSILEQTEDQSPVGGDPDMEQEVTDEENSSVDIDSTAAEETSSQEVSDESRIAEGEHQGDEPKKGSG
ncbi:MAG: VWA domain-containing protein [Gammaproteobacteria bacterium]|nr:VWA domain-containing protein [Gammaproteobacteria bacterium]